MTYRRHRRGGRKIHPRALRGGDKMATKGSLSELAGRCKDFSADPGLDGTETKGLLWDDYAIRPLIDTRELGREEKQQPDNDPSKPITRALHPERTDTIVHTEKGTLRCVCPVTQEQRELALRLQPPQCHGTDQQSHRSPLRLRAALHPRPRQDDHPRRPGHRGDDGHGARSHTTGPPQADALADPADPGDRLAPASLTTAPFDRAKPPRERRSPRQRARDSERRAAETCYSANASSKNSLDLHSNSC